jgi:phage major head subunit gpT-like protein
MIVTDANLNVLKTSFNASFRKGLAAPSPLWNKVATKVKSTNASNTYGWLSEFPEMSEWVGSRKPKDMQEHGYTLTNKHYESSVEVNANHIYDDEYGLYATIFESAGKSAIEQYDKLIFELLSKGSLTASVCFDGKPFFYNKHPIGGSDEQSNVIPTKVPAQTSKPWYLLDTSRPLKPMVLQERQAPRMVSHTDMTSSSMYESNTMKFGIDLRAAAGYGFWQMAGRNENPLSEDSVWELYSKMRQFKSRNGRTLSINPDVLVVPLELEKLANKLIATPLINGGETNTLYNKFKIVASPYLI